MATIKTQIKAIIFNGPITSFSFLLGDDKFTIEPKIKKARTNQMAIFAALKKDSKAIPALLITITAKNSKITICTNAT